MEPVSRSSQQHPLRPSLARCGSSGVGRHGRTPQLPTKEKAMSSADPMEIVTPSGRRARIIGWHPDEGVVTVRSIAADESGIASTGVMHVHVVPPFNMLSVPGVARTIQ